MLLSPCTRRRTKRKVGSVLPLTMIIIAFGTLMLFAAGSQLSRSTNHLASFKAIAKYQVIASNAVEIAAYKFINGNNLEMNDTWSGVVDFKAHVSNRGGAEGTDWAYFLSGVNGSTHCRVVDLTSLTSDSGLGGDSVAVEAYVYKIGSRYLVIASAGSGGIKRYSAGLVAGQTGGEAQAALRLESLERVLTVMNAKNPSGNRITGDFIFGDVIILDEVSLYYTDGSVPNTIISGSLSAGGITVGGSLNIDDILNGFPGWFNELTPEQINELSALWRQEYDELLPEGTEIVSLVLNENRSFTQEDSNSGVLYVIDPPSPLGSNQKSIFEAAFDDNGFEITHLILEEQSNKKWETVDNKKFTFPAPTAPNTLNIQINGNVEFVGKQVGSSNNTHKIDVINGKYNISVLGDVELSSNMVYSELQTHINNGNGNSPVGNKTKDAATDTINGMIEALQGSSSWLNLAAIGGDIRSNMSNSSHGNQTISASLYAFKENGVGGNVLFPDVSDIPGGQTPQFYLLGGVTASGLGDTTDLDSIVIVALPRDSSGEIGVTTSRLALYGMQSW